MGIFFSRKPSLFYNEYFPGGFQGQGLHEKLSLIHTVYLDKVYLTRTNTSHKFTYWRDFFSLNQVINQIDKDKYFSGGSQALSTLKNPSMGKLSSALPKTLQSAMPFITQAKVNQAHLWSFKPFYYSFFCFPNVFENMKLMHPKVNKFGSLKHFLKKSHCSFDMSVHKMRNHINHLLY